MEDGDGIYSSVECYHSPPKKVAVWVSMFIKNIEIVNHYIALRQRLSLPVEMYENFNNFLCVVEIDSEKGLYRATATTDFDRAGQELGISAVLEDNGKTIFKGKIKGDWSPVSSKNTHRSIKKLFSFIYGSMMHNHMFDSQSK